MKALIDYPDYWDALRLVESAQQQTWNEHLAVLCPHLDDTKDVIPQPIAQAVLRSPGYAMLRRVQSRIFESYRSE